MTSGRGVKAGTRHLSANRHGDAMPLSKSRLTKRRTRAEMDALRDGLREIVTANRPVTCRQAFYLAVSAGLVPKTEGSYKNTVNRLLTMMRRSGEIPFGHIVDFTRTMRKPPSFSGLEDALREAARLYRRNIWPGIGVRVEIWSEKETLVGVLSEETFAYDAPLMACRGYPSLSFLYAAGAEIAAANVPTFIYYFGDLDPSGVDIPRKVEQGLHDFAPDAEIYFERLAVNPAQIAAYDLQTRPTKTTDTRSKTFAGNSVEVEAIPPATLRSLCRDAIERHIPAGALDGLLAVEESERKQLAMFASARSALYRS